MDYIYIAKTRKIYTIRGKNKYLTGIPDFHFNKALNIKEMLLYFVPCIFRRFLSSFRRSLSCKT